MDSIGDMRTFLMSFVMTLNCGNNVDDDKNYATRVKMLKFLDQIVETGMQMKRTRKQMVELRAEIFCIKFLFV